MRGKIRELKNNEKEKTLASHYYKFFCNTRLEHLYFPQEGYKVAQTDTTL